MFKSGPTSLVAASLVGGAIGAALAVGWLGTAPLRPSQVDTRPSPAVSSADRPTFADAVSRAAPAVVSVFATQSESVPGAAHPPSYPGLHWAPPGAAASRTALGSGVILSADGLVLTNGHVIRGAEQVKAVLADGRALDLTLLGVDPDTDLAVLKADASGLPTAPLGQAQSLRVGDLAFAIGNPFGVGQTVTMGIVSATGRTDLGLTQIENFIQTDAAINPGNSGGALINSAGELIGINTAIFTETGSTQGIGFAVPVELAIGVAQALATQGRVTRGWIGMSGRSVTPALAESFGLRTPQGVLVASTLRDSPAAHAGLRPGDVVTRIDDRDVATVQDLLEAITNAGPDTALDLEIWRGSERIITQARTDDRPPPME
jgi:serine protease DegS